MSEKAKSSKKKKDEPIELDDNTLMIARELFKHISILNLDINQHNNRKTIIISQKELNDYLNINIKLSHIKDLKSVNVNILDNDNLEIELAIEKFDSKANLKKEIKLNNSYINATDGFFSFTFADTYNTKGNDLTAKITVLITNFIFKSFLLPEIIKKFNEEKVTQNNEFITIDFREGYFKTFYQKTMNEILNTNIPFFGKKHLTEIIEIESIMCEKGQIWVDFIFKI